MSPLTLLILLGLLAWWWVSGMRAREAAVAAARAACHRTGVQLLDETVALSRVRLGRDDHGRVQWRRTYRFEVAPGPTQRLDGSLQLLGNRLVHLELDVGDGRVWEGGPPKAEPDVPRRMVPFNPPTHRDGQDKEQH